MDEKIVVDGIEIPREKLPYLIEDAKKQGHILKEVSPGVFKTLQKLKD